MALRLGVKVVLWQQEGTTTTTTAIQQGPEPANEVGSPEPQYQPQRLRQHQLDQDVALLLCSNLHIAPDQRSN